MNDTKNLDENIMEKNKIEEGTLYLVATPIGNLSDLSPRALKVLEGVDFIAAEDTRNSAKLLACFDLKRPMVPYHEHNKKEKGPQIIKRLMDGQSCALVTDAGTPAISDPGEDLVRLCRENAIPVTAVPGCCAAVDALSLSGLPTGKFVFEGFLPSAHSERCKRLEMLKPEGRTVLFYEAPHRLKETLEDILTTIGDRKISLCRELTKRNEEVLLMSVAGAIAYYQTHEPRGEYVLVIAGCSEEERRADAFWAEMNMEEHVAYYMQKDATLHPNDAIKLVAKDRKVAKSVVYNAVHKLS